MDAKTKRWLLLQIGLALVLFVLFIGILNSVVYSTRIPILTTDDLWQSNTTVAILYRNSTTNAEIYQQFSLTNISTYYNGRIYMAIPPPPNGYDSIAYIQVYLNRTLGDLAANGFNYIELYFDGNIMPVRNTSMSFLGIASRLHWCSGCPFTIDNYRIEPIVYDYWGNILKNNTYNKSVDPALFAMKAASWGSTERAVFFIGGGGGQLFTASYIVFDLKLYTVSEKPLLRGLMEPIYPFFAALYAAFMSVLRRVKQVLLSAFGGFVSSFTLTGLIGDPVVALILTIIFITIVFLVIKPHRKLKL